MKKLLPFLLYISILALPYLAEATTYYADPAGKGIVCTASSTPCSAAVAVSQMASGDRIEFMAGTYTIAREALTLPSGTVGAHTVVTTYLGGNVVFAGQNPFALYSNSREYIDFIGACTTGTSRTCTMTWDGTTDVDFFAASITINKTGAGGGSTNILFDGIRVTNYTGTATNIASSNITFRNCRYDHNGAYLDASSQAGYNFYLGWSNSTIENCEIDNAGGYGIHQYSSDQSPSNNTYRYNIIHDNGQTVSGNVADGILLAGSSGGVHGSNNAVYGNIIYNNLRGYGVRLNPCNNCVVYNNTIYGNGTTNGATGIAYWLGSGSLIKNNIISANNSTMENTAGGSPFSFNLCGPGACALGTNNVTESAATTFTTPGSNFTLKAGSGALNSGTALSSPYDRDILAVARPQGVAFDMGAYESVTGITPPTITITAPTSNTTLTTSSSAIAALAGTATDTISVAWTCDRCTVTSGSATGTSSWVLPALTLKSGINIITVTATSASLGTATDTLTVTYAPTFPGNALVLALAMDAGSGTTAVDSTINSNTATFVNTPTWAGTSNGRYGNAIVFDGISQHLIVADSNSLDLTQSFTVSMWVKPSAANTDFRSILAKTDTPNGPPYRLFASIIGYCGTGGVAGFSNVNGVSGPDDNICSVSPLQINVWTHLAVTYDNATGLLKLYRSDQPGTVVSTSHSGYMEPSAGVLYIARSEYGEYFQGTIDELRIYNYAIPQTGGANTVYGNNCTRADEATTPSIIGDANCPITAPTPPLSIKISSAAAGFKVDAGASSLKFGSTSGTQ